jgi:hypothetical protein
MNINDFDPQSHVGPLPSPCIDVCQMDARSGLCVGCLRTIDEIVRWGSADENEKRAVWSVLKQRWMTLG